MWLLLLALFFMGRRIWQILAICAYRNKFNYLQINLMELLRYLLTRDLIRFVATLCTFPPQP